MAKKPIVALYKEFDIQVEPARPKGFGLIVNGKVISKCASVKDSYPDTPIMKTSLEVSDGKNETVEVFVLTGWLPKLKICVDGRYLAGQRF